MRRLLLWLGVAALAALGMAGAEAQQASPAAAQHAEFLRAADETLAAVSRLVELPVKEPLKKSIRSREQMRSYLLRQLAEDEKPAKRYADQKALERFGLIPPGFDLDAFLVEVLTEQVAGLYDPKRKEFYIADWVQREELESVMAHELVHALHDQYFGVESWVKAARPNDDALLARGAVLEGSAFAAMLDFILREQERRVRDLPHLGPLLAQMGPVDPEKNPVLARAPLYVREGLMFPYTAGTLFTQQVLKANAGWVDFPKVFQNPPVSTQQILHPELYFKGVAPEPVALPDLGRALPAGWKKLDENLVGEFGLHILLKQFLGQERAADLSPAWAGDRYAIFEHSKSKQTLLVFRLRLASIEDAQRFFGRYSEALERKHSTRQQLLRRPSFFSFAGDGGGVFLYCLGADCLTVEGLDREAFNRIVRAVGWPPAPAPPASPLRPKATVAAEVLLPSFAF